MTRMSVAIAAPPAGTYAIDPVGSKIAFTTKHMFGAGTVKGTFSDVSGTIVVADPVEGTHVTVRAAANSFDSSNAKRDIKVKAANFLHVAEHPHLTFESTRLVQEGAGWRLEGTLTARGGSAPLNLTVTEVTPDATGVKIQAEGAVDRYAHGITAAKGMAARMLQIKITAHATRS